MRNAFDTFEVKKSSKGGSVDISVIDSPGITAGINFHKLKESGRAPTNLMMKLSGEFNVNAENNGEKIT